MKTISTISKDGNLVLTKPSPFLLTTWYAEQVISGKIVAAEKVISACKRHMNDLKKSNLKVLKEEFPWVFDGELGHRPIRFIEKYCKPSKGNFKQLTLQAWQHFTLGSMFGWVHKETKLRRFKEGLVFVARKNGKTTKISGTSLYGVSKDGENGADIPLLANSMKQARLLFDEAKAMIKSSPKLKKRFRPLRDAIHFDQTFSKIEPQASDSEKLDGLNTHIGVFDEIHEFKDYKLINVIKNSRGSRDQPLLIYITTAGYQLDGPLVNYYEQGSDVLNGLIKDDRTFYYLAELDDPSEFDNPDMWIKANPNLGVSIKLSDMIEDWEKAKRTPAERNDFITKRFNIFVQSDEQSFLDYEVIKRNNKAIDLTNLKGKSCVGAFDLSQTEDFTSACLEFALDTGEVFVLSHSWVPEKKVLSDNEKINYREWEKEGFLTICKGDYVDYQLVYNWFVEKSKEYIIELITYDPANAYRLVEDLKSYGFNTLIVRQGYITLSPALKDVKELFLDGKVIFSEEKEINGIVESKLNELFRWYINNVKLVDDRNGNWLPTKQGRYRKIDGFAAFLNAHTEVMKKMVTPQGNGQIEFISIGDLFN
ncbi:phage terminase large subunit-like protein [Cytobacillus horneckiae]|uniref:terminase large subunit n=1 Tax=Cytobacillus horneckiae TaxID=549687 RepID=UPI0019D2F652|nr:terminase large subunit [Cytobacillus horneckiae]MBN6887014.1 terminase large subunit [Cytobacillus horneckiae]